jgi:AAA domain
MKAHPDINDTLREEGVEGVRARHDKAHRANGQSAAKGHKARAAAWWCDPADIPPRPVLYGRHYMRRTIGATIGAGGRAKTTVGTYEAISMAAGRDLMTKEPLPAGPLRVWCLNGEEDQEELDRRFAATCQHYGILQADLGGRLFVQSVRDHPWRIATMAKGAARIDQAVVAQIRDFITAAAIDVFMVDPLVSFHSVNENDNGAMDLVIKEGFGGIASATNSAGEIFHHSGKPKPGQPEATVEDGRGASAILNAVRSARVLNFMTPAEAQELGISEDDRRRHIRLANGKANMAPVGKAIWMRIEVENLPKGDEVACASSWKPPDPFKGLTTNDLRVAQELAQTGAHRADSRSPLWFGFALAKHLKLDVHPGCDNKRKDVARLKAIIKTWLKTNVLAIELREDEHRKKRQHIIPGTLRDTVGLGAETDDETITE